MSDMARENHGDLIASDRVEGTTVYNRQGERLGHISNFMVDKRSGQVRYAVLSFGGFLGMGTTIIRCPGRCSVTTRREAAMSSTSPGTYWTRRPGICPTNGRIMTMPMAAACSTIMG